MKPLRTNMLYRGADNLLKTLAITTGFAGTLYLLFYVCQFVIR
ncbi:hypothetical protein [Flexibacterium corallicola]|nr:hypothetical protein [Pseudovibrio sp. M1P-2-3]